MVRPRGSRARELNGIRQDSTPGARAVLGSREVPWPSANSLPSRLPSRCRHGPSRCGVTVPPASVADLLAWPRIGHPPPSVPPASVTASVSSTRLGHLPRFHLPRFHPPRSLPRSLGLRRSRFHPPRSLGLGHWVGRSVTAQPVGRTRSRFHPPRSLGLGHSPPSVPPPSTRSRFHPPRSLGRSVTAQPVGRWPTGQELAIYSGRRPRR